MHLVQPLLPIYDRDGRPFPARHYAATRETLVERFGGLTAYTRAPAEAVWREGGAPAARDHIVVYEVMVHELDRVWWGALRQELEYRFAQDELVVRAQPPERL